MALEWAGQRLRHRRAHRGRQRHARRQRHRPGPAVPDARRRRRPRATTAATTSRSTATATPLPLFGRYGETHGAAHRRQGAARQPGRLRGSARRARSRPACSPAPAPARGTARPTTSACCSSSPKGRGEIIDDENEVGGYPQPTPTRAPFVEADWDLDTMTAEIRPLSRARRHGAQEKLSDARQGDARRAGASEPPARSPCSLAAAPPMVVIDEARHRPRGGAAARRDRHEHRLPHLATPPRSRARWNSAAASSIAARRSASIRSRTTRSTTCLGGDGRGRLRRPAAPRCAGHGRLSLQRRGRRHPPDRHAAAVADHQLSQQVSA